jgi:alanyl-tRNA synthetase
MQKLSHFEVRNRFVEYFKKQNHAHVGSSSLIPENDPTLLFANAGMNQFKNVFLGLEHRDYKRAVTVQKCVRAGGKHNDLDNVGFTARHHTFFEMLGNFSFGDYFKKEAIHFAWEFLTKELGIPKEKLYVTVFQNDDEAAEIWHKQEGVPLDRIFRFGEKDNFWRMGDTGPCGPCTEIFYDHGPKAGRISDPFKGIAAGEDRFVEIWNLVFMQFYEKSPGVMDPLPQPSVDTGSGLERVTAAMQGKLNNYDTDLFMPMIEKACQIAGWKADKLLGLEDKLRSNRELAEIEGHSAAQVREDLAALRVLADHARSSSFLIADGALPSNEGRGYVLRRILRRAIRYGRKISEKHSFLPALSEVLIETMGSVYPELKSRRDVILATIREEESRFLQTLDQGTQILNEELKRLKSQNQKQVPGDFVFKLYDTYGFPADLTRLMAEEKGFTVDEANFEKSMEAAREKAKASWKGKALASDETHLIEFSQKVLDQHKATVFTGYETTTDESEVVALSTGSAQAATLGAGQTGVLVTKKTPFYAEGGGQVGDLGDIKTSSAQMKVHNTTKQNNVYLHHVEVISGAVKVGDRVTLAVSSSDRRRTAANHSATHLLHAALRKVLGTHVTQAGSLVDAAKLRFDFTHNKALTAEEIVQIEAMVNAEISKANNVQTQVMKYKDAIAAGALALFGEKYGDEVRVCKMGDFSTELCGGTHVGNTAQIRMFKIVSEGGVSAGVRRIEALTGDGAFDYFMKHTQENMKARNAAGINESWTAFLESKNEPALWIENAKTEIKNLEKEIKKLQGGSINVDSLAQGAKKFSAKGTDSQLIFADLQVEDRDVLAQVTDQLKNKIQSGVVIVIGQGSGTHPLIVSVTKNLNPEISAGSLLKELAATMGGKGGGRPDFAQGAVPDRSKIQDAFSKARQILNVH